MYSYGRWPWPAGGNTSCLVLEGSSLSALGAASGLCLWEFWGTALLQGLPWGTTGVVLGWEGE